MNYARNIRYIIYINIAVIYVLFVEILIYGSYVFI